jgi:predicted nucleotidyltransferase
MIVNRVLDHLFTSPAIIAVLRQLELRNAGITGRNIARLSGITHRSALNRSHYLYKNVISQVFHAERELKGKLTSKIKNSLGKLSESILIFGSVARNRETYKSDFDLCIIYSKNKGEIEKRLSSLRDNLYDEFGISLAPFLITLTAFKSKSKNKKPPVNNIIKEGKVIAGKTIGEIING